MRKTIIFVGLCLFVLWPAVPVFASNLEQKLVTRVDDAIVKFKHKTLTVTALGMGRTPTPMGRGGKLVRRNADHPVNKDGLVEYDLVFYAVPNYTGFKMKPIKATITDRSVPDGVKGARIFGEYNSFDALLPEPKKSKGFLSFGKKKEKESPETTGAITGASPHP